MRNGSMRSSKGAVSRIAGLAAAILVPYLVPVCAASDVRLRIGIVADPHLETDPAADSCRHLEDAFRYFEKRGADGVVMPGDLTTWGLVPQLRNVADIWNRVFPGGRRQDGGTVEKLFVYGDHDVGGYMQDRAPLTDEQRKAWIIPWNDRKAQWEKAFGEPWNPVQVKEVKGYRFYLAHLLMDKDDPDHRQAGVDLGALEAMFAAHPPPAAPTPFFYVQHLILKGTAGGPAAGGDKGKTREFLSRYPNAVTFSGSAHIMATDETCAWMGAFAAFEAPGLCCPLTGGGRENGFGGSDQKRMPIVPPPQMKRINGWPLRSWQGLFMTVYDDRIVVERIDFADGQSVASPWEFAVTSEGPRFLMDARERPVPAFAKGTKPMVEIRTGKDAADHESEQYVVGFPILKEPRAYEYEITVRLVRDEVNRIVTQRRVYSPEAIRSVRYEPDAMEVPIAVAEICTNYKQLVFEIRPLDSFGRMGPPISASLRNGRWK